MKTPSEIQGAKNLQYIAAQGWATLAEIQATEASKTERKKNRREYTLHAQNTELRSTGEMDARPAYLHGVSALRFYRNAFAIDKAKGATHAAAMDKVRFGYTLKNSRTRRKLNRAGIILPF